MHIWNDVHKLWKGVGGGFPCLQVLFFFLHYTVEYEGGKKKKKRPEHVDVKTALENSRTIRMNVLCSQWSILRVCLNIFSVCVRVSVYVPVCVCV